MTVQYCAELVKAADEDRFLSAMTAKPDLRAALFALYAFNVEVSNAAWASKEPLLCQMRLQYLRDMLTAVYAGDTLPNIPLAQPLAEVIRRAGLPQSHLVQMIDARAWDTGGETFQSMDELRRYLDWTAGNLMVLAARTIGVIDHYYDAVRMHGYAMGVAKFLMAVPELKAHGRVPLPVESADALVQLAQGAKGGIMDARRIKIVGGQAALRAGWDTMRVLDLVIRAPERVLEGRLQTSPFRRKTTLLFISLLG